LALRLITTPLAIVVILGIVFITDYRWETVLVILLVGLARAAESVSDVFYGLLQQRERMDRVAKSMVIKGLLSLIALSLGVYYLGSVVWGAVGLLFAWTLVLLAYDIWSGAVVLQDLPQGRPRLTSRKALLSKLQPRWQIKTLKELVRLALPLGVVAALGN
jgi:O-antigen/teichoic acid export membrane protein